MPVGNGKRSLIVYFVAAFAISWTTWTPAIMLKTGLFTPILLFVGLFGPAISAIIITAKTGGANGVRQILAGYGRLRFRPPFWLMVFLLVPLIFLMSAIVYPSKATTPIFTGNSAVFLIASFVYLIFINSGEETGWRGFALPRLQDLASLKSNSLIASLILGIIWAIWHLPIYLVPGQSSFPYPLFFAFTVGVSIVYTVVYNNTKRSLFAVTALHASTDIMPRILAIASFTVMNWSIIVGLTWAAALILVIWFGPRRLSRGD